MTVREAMTRTLREARLERAIDSRKLSSMMGKYPTFISKIETGWREMTVGEFLEAARALDVSPVKLLRNAVRLCVENSPNGNSSLETDCAASQIESQ